MSKVKTDCFILERYIENDVSKTINEFNNFLKGLLDLPLYIPSTTHKALLRQCVELETILINRSKKIIQEPFTKPATQPTEKNSLAETLQEDVFEHAEEKEKK